MRTAASARTGTDGTTAPDPSPSGDSAAAGGTGSQPDILTVADALDRWVAMFPDRVAHTFLDHLGPDPDARHSYTWAELDTWTRATAAALTHLTGPGGRVAILCPSGPEYVVAVLAALRAGVVAVPLFTPDLRGHADRLAGVLTDCRPDVVVTTAARHDAVHAFLTGLGLPVPAVLCADDLAGPAGSGTAARFRQPAIDPDDLAYLQYTSGSTRTPTGVALTHRNLAVNAYQMIDLRRIDPLRTTAVSWLPPYHDMGLMLGITAPALIGAHAVVMDPMAFILRPLRWLQALAEHPETVTAAPNFAYDLTTRRVGPEQRAGLDLSRVRTLVNGAEPVLPGTVRRFADAFGPCGLSPAAMAPSYGLAEATVLVATTPAGEEPFVLTVDAQALESGRLHPVPELVPGEPDVGVRTLVGSGRPAGQRVAIVDPESLRRLGPDEVGEIWVQGGNVATGYWNRPGESVATFGVRTAPAAGIPGAEGGPGAESGSDGTDDPGAAQGWLRTGDLGVLYGGQLLVTGRLKDLIVIDGRNLYPQDLEQTVQEAHPAIAFNRLAAFAVPLSGGEGIVVVGERDRNSAGDPGRVAEVDQAVRAAVARRHAVSLHDFVLVEPDSIARTSSGKIARTAVRAAYLGGGLARVTGDAGDGGGQAPGLAGVEHGTGPAGREHD